MHLGLGGRQGGVCLFMAIRERRFHVLLLFYWARGREWGLRTFSVPPASGTIPNTSTAVLSIRTHFLNYDLHHAASLSSLESLFLH